MKIFSLGGNAIIRRGEEGTIEEQQKNAAHAMRCVARLAASGTPIVITHGNGPIVGNIVLQNEAARGTVPTMPLYIADADSEGGIGFMIQQTLHNELKRIDSSMEVATVVTQVVVDPEDPAFSEPTKPIGPFYGKEEAERLKEERDYAVMEVAPGSFRRVVPSPRPLKVVEAGVVKRLADSGVIVIAAGGGGVPVAEDRDGMLRGVEAVIDKDLATSLLARELGAEAVIILTDVDSVFLDFGKPGQRPIARMNLIEARAYMEAGHFLPGSMGPKITAAVEFLESGGHEVVITSPELIEEALRGETGTFLTTR